MLTFILYLRLSINHVSMADKEGCCKMLTDTHLREEGIKNGPNYAHVISGLPLLRTKTWVNVILAKINYIKSAFMLFVKLKTGEAQCTFYLDLAPFRQIYF